MMHYYFAGFCLDVERRLLYDSSKVEIGKGRAVELIRFLAEREWQRVSDSTVENGLKITNDALRKRAANARTMLQDPDKKLIERFEGAYQLSADVYRGAEPAVPDPPGLDPEIPPALVAGKLTRQWAGSDDFIQLAFRSGWDGWSRKDVDFKGSKEEKYEPPPELKAVMELHPFPHAVNQLWSLRDLVPDQNFDDSWPRLMVKAIAGNYYHVKALTEAWNCAKKGEHAECVAFRKKFRTRWWPVSESPLYHNVNAQVTVISQDGFVVICKRPTRIGFAPGVWSASVEEQMLRCHHKTEEEDATLFTCAERGVKTELGINLETARTKLLRVGLEWGNFTAAFCFVAWSPRTFDEIVSSWTNIAETPQEAVALDRFPADPKAIYKAISSDTWSPTRHVETSPDAPDELTAKWHYTSRARLFGTARHLEYLRGISRESLSPPV